MAPRGSGLLAVIALGGAACSAAKPAVSGGVLQFHGNLARDGVYVEPQFTRAAAPSMRLDPTFAGAIFVGASHGQPLYLEGSAGKPDLVFVATMENHVTAFDAQTGAQVWDRVVGTPVPILQLPCGTREAGVFGILSTPVIDGATRIIYLDALTTPDDGTTKAHQVFALDADTGSSRPGWPVDVGAHVRFGSTAFDSAVQGQHAALALVGGTVYVGYGAQHSDCNMFHGTVVGIETSDPTRVTWWSARAYGGGGGVWAPGGIVSDGTSLYFATGNTAATMGWGDGEAVFRLPRSLSFSGSAADYFAPTNWADLDHLDADLGSTAPLLVDVPGATPSSLLVVAGKEGKALLLDRANLGGIGAPLASIMATVEGIIGANVAYTTPAGTFVAMTNQGLGCPPGESGRLMALKIVPGAPPSFAVSWCTLQEDTMASPAVSMTDTHGTDTILWIVGINNRLFAIDGETGQKLLAGGPDTLPGVLRHEKPIIAKGRLFVVGLGQVFAFKPN